MSDLQQQLKDLTPLKEYFIGIDSDGCAFDTMEIKHKECFCPNLIKYFNLQPIAKYVREVWEFTNLYSITRGANRFITLIETFRLLEERQEIKSRHFTVPDISAVRKWTQTETQLGNPVLEAYAKKVNDPVIDQALAWSCAVNTTVKEMVKNIAPFPGMKESLEKIFPLADAMVISQTPVEALEREWSEHEIKKFVRMIAGQEYGTKTQHLALAAKGKYRDDHILMIGDAPGDYKAAKNNGVLFFPVVPGQEEQSWELLYQEGLDRFFSGHYAGDYENRLIREFNDHLPETPPWKQQR